MWATLGFQICFHTGNDMSWVHGSVDSVVGGGLLGLPWTGGNGGRCGSSELSARTGVGGGGSRTRELDATSQRQREIIAGLCSRAAKGGGKA
jgi:hypothetical protein